MKNQFAIGHIARVCHEANRALTIIIQDVPVQPPWDEAPEEMRLSAVNGVIFNIENPDAPPSASHDNWMQVRLSNGWTLGPVKDAEKKTHPALVPYEQLPEAVQRKDRLFKAIVGALS